MGLGSSHTGHRPRRRERSGAQTGAPGNRAGVLSVRHSHHALGVPCHLLGRRQLTSLSRAPSQETGSPARRPLPAGPSLVMPPRVPPQDPLGRHRGFTARCPQAPRGTWQPGPAARQGPAPTSEAPLRARG